MKKGKIVLSVCASLLCVGVLTGCNNSSCKSSSGDDEGPANWNDVAEFLNGMFTQIQYVWEGAEYSWTSITSNQTSERHYYMTPNSDGYICGNGSYYDDYNNVTMERSWTADYSFYLDGDYIYERCDAITNGVVNDTTYTKSSIDDDTYTYSVKKMASFITDYIDTYSETDGTHAYDTNYGKSTVRATKTKYSVAWTVVYLDGGETDYYEIKVGTNSDYVLNYFSWEHSYYSRSSEGEPDTIETYLIQEDKEVSTSKPSWVNSKNFSD